jgi:glycerophosphoryl diester phosphodiesterase
VLGIDRLVLPYPRAVGRPLIYGHRGASADAPENTLEAFALAAEQGADGVELDVMVCGSGEVVVVHDPWLDRLTGQRVLVHATALTKLQTLNVAHHFRDGKTVARLPTLDAVLAATAPLQVNIELKEDRLRDAGLARKVADLIARHGAEKRVTLSSFNALELLRLRAIAPRLPIGFLFERQQPPWLRWGLPAPLLAAQAVHPEHVLLSPVRVAAWQRAGFRVATWTVNEPERARVLAAMGVDALITNRPAVLRAAL